MKVLIVYYSMFGNVYKMSRFVAEGVKQVQGAEPVVRTVKEIIPDSVIQSREDMKRGRDMQKEVPLVTENDFRQADAVIFGTPTRFGNVCAQLKGQIDPLGDLWGKGELEGKAAGVFVSTAALGNFQIASKASAAFEERWGNPGEQPLVAEQAIEVLAWVDIRLIWMDAAVVLSQLKFLSASEQVKE